jgi:hypothetical protein
MTIKDELGKFRSLSGKAFKKAEDAEGMYFLPRESREFTGAELIKVGDKFQLTVGNFSEATGTLEELQKEFNFTIEV